MPNFKRKFLGLLLPVMGIAALTSCNYLTEAKAENEDEDSINVRNQFDNGLNDFDFDFSDDSAFKTGEPSIQPTNTKVIDQPSEPINVKPVEEQEGPQTDRGSKGPEVEEIEEEVEDTTKLFNITLNKQEVELDAGNSRSFRRVSDSLQGNLYPAFATNDDIVCTYTAGDGYSLNSLKVKWSIPNEDLTYFSMNILDNGLGTSTARITALKESRLSTLSVSVVLKENENVVLASSECELRSVMTNAYWVGNYDKTVLSGEDVSAFGSGYTARLYNTTYNRGEDIVVPSKLNIDGVIKPLRRLVGFATITGLSGINGASNALCRNLYIPNNVIQLSSYALGYTQPTGKIVFADGDCNVLFGTSTAFYNPGTDTTNSGYFYSQIAEGKAEVTFPYNYYLRDVAEKATSHVEMQEVKDVSLAYLISINNNDTLLFKKN